MQNSVMVVGEALVDVVNGTPHVGGSPLNVAVGLARLGHDVSFVGRLGHDEYGSLISDHLRANTVRCLLPPDRHPSSAAIATLDSTGSASYEFELVWELPPLPEWLPAALEGARAVHTGSIATLLPPGADTVLEAIQSTRTHGALISFDPNCRPSITPDTAAARAKVEAFVALSDVVKASDEDMVWLYPERPIEASAEAWRQLGPALVVVTRGSSGALAAHANGLVTVPAPPVVVADTVGAGDSFMAALLAGFLDLGDDPRAMLTPASIEALLRQATAAAAITVGRVGANPPTREELASAAPA